ncbi:hypothetical protein BH20ACI3_BH20ACI3_15900 [soil metagenome]
MRFLFGVLVGYSMRGKSRLLITVLATLVLTVYVVVPAIALLALHLDVQKGAPVETSSNRGPGTQRIEL